MKMTDRIAQAKKDLQPFQTEYVVVYEDIDMNCCGVMHPDPHAMSALMAGGVFPPVWVYWELAKDEAKPNFKKHTRLNLLDDTPREPAKTEKQALEFLLMKDVPSHIWMNYKTSNSVSMVICKRDQLPNKDFRDAWRIAA